MILDTAPESVAPLLYFLVGEGNGVDAVGFRRGIRGTPAARWMSNSFLRSASTALFQAEGISGRLGGRQFKNRSIFERIKRNPRRGRIKNILYPLGVVVLRHENLLPCGTLPLFQL